MQSTSSFIAHDVAKGVLRLVSAAGDLPTGGPSDDAPGGQRDSATHRELFADYVTHLRWAVALAVPWWTDLVRARIRRGEDEAAAVRSSYMLRPAGPASRPEVVWVVRSYWLACVQLNGRVGARQAVRPETFLVQWLRDAGHDLELQVVSGMPYWPVGLDERGCYC